MVLPSLAFAHLFLSCPLRATWNGPSYRKQITSVTESYRKVKTKNKVGHKFDFWCFNDGTILWNCNQCFKTFFPRRWSSGRRRAVVLDNPFQVLYLRVRWAKVREKLLSVLSGNTKGGSINVPLNSCLTGLDNSVLQIKTKIFSCHTADSKPVKQEVNGTVILPPLVFRGLICVSGFSWTGKRTQDILFFN